MVLNKGSFLIFVSLLRAVVQTRSVLGKEKQSSTKKSGFLQTLEIANKAVSSL